MIRRTNLEKIGTTTVSSCFHNLKIIVCSISHKLCLLDGVECLLKKGVQDEPLLQLARNKSDVVSFVYIVQDIKSIQIDSDGDSSISPESSNEEEEDNWEHFEEDSQEENEFE